TSGSTWSPSRSRRGARLGRDNGDDRFARNGRLIRAASGRLYPQQIHAWRHVPETDLLSVDERSGLRRTRRQGRAKRIAGTERIPAILGGQMRDDVDLAARCGRVVVDFGEQRKQVALHELAPAGGGC